MNLFKVWGVLIALVGMHLASNAQAVKEWYTSNWQKTDSTYADYYRIIQYSPEGQALGIVRDYFKTGEIQFEGYYSFIDPVNHNNDILNGKCTWYYQNGKKQTEGNFLQGLKNGRFYYWNEDGKAESSYSFYNDSLDGLCLEWYPNGGLAGYANFKRGRVQNSYSLLCNEFGECLNISLWDFLDGYIPTPKTAYSYEYYSSYSRSNDYEDFIFFDVNYYTEESFDEYGMPYGFTGFSKMGRSETRDLFPEGKFGKTELKYTFTGLTANNKGTTPYTHLIPAPLDYAKDFRITTRVDILKGGMSLLFAYTDAGNYMKISLNKEGAMIVGGKENGKDIEIYKSLGVPYSSSNYSYNTADYITINKYKDSIEFTTNYTVGTRIKYKELIGTQVGFEIDPKSEVALLKLSIVEAGEPTFVSPDFDVQKGSAALWKGTGSGFVISQDGYIVTNHHVVDGSKQVEIDLIRDGKKVSYSAEVVVSDKVNDLAILLIKDDDFTGFPEIPYTLKTELADVGTPVFALGYPLAFSALSDELKFTEGTISSRTGREGMVMAYQVSTPVQPGNSGGPLFDFDGNLLGVINEKIMFADNVAFAIKSNYITNLIALLPKEILLPQGKKLEGMEASEQVKEVREFIPLIKVR